MILCAVDCRAESNPLPAVMKMAHWSELSSLCAHLDESYRLGLFLQRAKTEKIYCEKNVKKLGQKTNKHSVLYITQNGRKTF